MYLLYNCNDVRLKRPKINYKRGRGWPIFEKSLNVEDLQAVGWGEGPRALVAQVKASLVRLRDYKTTSELIKMRKKKIK